MGYAAQHTALQMIPLYLKLRLLLLLIDPLPVESDPHLPRHSAYEDFLLRTKPPVFRKDDDLSRLTGNASDREQDCTCRVRLFVRTAFVQPDGSVISGIFFDIGKAKIRDPFRSRDI